MIVIVAPYSPVGRAGVPALGAARKLETVIGVLSLLGENVVLVNTAHNATDRSGINTEVTTIAGVRLTEITLPTSAGRALGKLVNLFQVKAALRAVCALGAPSLVWVYNGYAFEAMFAVQAKRAWGAPVVLEFEDWHFARGRGFNPKPYVDYLCWMRALKSFDYCFGVNRDLLERAAPIPGSVLPGVVPEALIRIQTQHPAFKSVASMRVGYFGGLVAEKGADVVYELVSRLPEGYTLVVTGSGALEGKFNALSASGADCLEFHGCVSDQKLYELIESCDVLLNPHSPIDEMAGGVFPFKVIEAIASGRALISTALPPIDDSVVTQGVLFAENNPDSFLEAILTARAFYESSSVLIDSAAKRAAELYGEDAIKGVVEQLMGRSVN